MATVVNASDIELQATSPRLVAVAGPTNVTTDFAQVNGTTKPSDNADVTVTAINGAITVTGGGITLSGGGSIKGGQSGYDSGTGFFLGYSSATYKFSIGNSGGSKLTWDGSALAIVGDITGASNLTITGQATFGGNHSSGGYSSAVFVNQGYGSVNGVVSFSSGFAAFALRGIAQSAATAVSGEATGGGTGVNGASSGSGGIGVSASGTSGAIALQIVGAATMDNSTWTWNGYTMAAPAGSSTTVLHNDGVWRDPVTTARVNSAFGVSANGVCQLVVGDTGTATVSGSGVNINCGTGLAGTYQFACSSNNIVLQTVSDIRLKQDIEPEGLGLDFILSLAPKTYRMRADKKNQKTRYHGFIADHMQTLVPDADSLFIVNDNGLKGIDYVSIIAPLVLAVQQLTERVIKLETKKTS